MKNTLRGPTIPPFYADEIGKLAAIRNRAGLSVVSMNFGQPSEGAPAAAIEAAHHYLDHDVLGYFKSGELIERLSLHYQQTYGVEIQADRFLLTSGASAGLVAAFSALFQAGDRVAIFKPGYPAYRNTLKAMGIIPVEIQCGEEQQYQPTVEMIAALDPKPEGLILASPANPTGVMLSETVFSDIIDYCRDHHIYLISDEIYHGITFGNNAASALQFDSNVVVINSFSKLYRMPGWRLGWLIAPRDWVDQLSACLINMFLTPPSLSQHAALAAMGDQVGVNRSITQYRQNRDRLITGLAALGIDRIAPPDGAFYLYANVDHITADSLNFCKRAVIETGLALAPGIDFDPELGHQFIRFSFAVSAHEIEQALSLLADWLPHYADERL